MFSAYCDRTGTDILMGTSHVRSFTNTEDGVTFEYECVCGTTGRYHARTGSGRHGSTEIHHLVA